MGYRFAIRSLDHPSHAKAGDQLELCMWLENRGVAPIYRSLPFRLRLRGGAYQCIVDTGLDIRRWLPGDSVESFTVLLPQDIPAGSYLLEAGIGEGTPGSPAVQLAMEGENDRHFWILAKIEIE